MIASTKELEVPTADKSSNESNPIAVQEAMDSYLSKIRGNADLLKYQFAKLENVLALHKSLIGQKQIAEVNSAASLKRPKLYIVTS